MNYSESEPFCGPIWNSTQHFITKYMYGSTTLVLQAIGTPFCILTVIIFAKNALSSANILFTGLAISDLLVLVLGIPQMALRITHGHIHFALDQGSYSYTEAEKYADQYMYTGQRLFYNISLYQTTMLAIWRYIAITHPLKERTLCSVKMTSISVAIIYALCFLYFLPDFLKTPQIYGTPDVNDNVPYALLFITGLRLIPCIIVTICTIRFILVLRKSRTRRNVLITNFNNDLKAKEKQTNRTTKMVLGIMIFFLINNIYSIIGRVLILIYGSSFKKYCYPTIICLNNLLTVIYIVIPFVVYYVTSTQFRDNFKKLI